MPVAKDYEPKCSQRKLFRVKKWKDVPRDRYQKMTFKKERVKNTEEHDFILMTDNEEFVQQDIQVLEGIHHLPDTQGPFNSIKH